MYDIDFLLICLVNMSLIFLQPYLIKTSWIVTIDQKVSIVIELKFYLDRYYIDYMCFKIDVLLYTT